MVCGGHQPSQLIACDVYLACHVTQCVDKLGEALVKPHCGDSRYTVAAWNTTLNMARQMILSSRMCSAVDTSLPNSLHAMCTGPAMSHSVWISWVRRW